MKKAIKVLLVIVVIAGMVTGGLYFYYNYNQGKKVAQVVCLNNVIMQGGFYGDSIQSYGQVTADKAQSGYIPSGTEVLSVNVAVGDHVNAGDVIMTVKKESQDIVGKELEVQKAAQAYIADKNRLERLQNTKPIPEYIASSPDTRDVTMVTKSYFMKEGKSIEGYSYKTEDIVYSIKDNGRGEKTTDYFEPGGKYLDPEKSESKAKIDDLKSKIAAAQEAGEDILREYTTEDTMEIVVGTFYYDGETGNIIGHEGIGANGEVVERYEAPKGYKPSELKKEIETVTKSLMKSDLELRVQQSQLEQMRNTDDSGAIYAKVSGTVSKIQNIDNYNANQPFFIVTATDDYYITGSIGEFYLEDVKVGDTVTINSWETGTTAEAVITSIDDSPSKDDNYWGGSGNSNSSHYAFKAHFDKNAGIEIGAPVDISITPNEESVSGLYIPNYFVRKDASGSYVMRMNEAGVLEKVNVKVGKSLWGSMYEIKSGITQEDYLAFPYGNGAIEGIKCETTDSLDSVYGGGLG